MTSRASAVELLSLDSPVFSTFVFWSAILIHKTLFMAALTALQRFRHRCFASSEDVKFLEILPGKASVVQYDNPSVERVRRSHLNDLENVIPFILAGFFYVLTDPAVDISINLFRVAAACRILHTFVYAVYPVPQPARILAFLVPYLITAFMTAQTALHIYHLKSVD